MPLEPAAYRELQEAVAYEREEREARYKDVVDIWVLRTLIFKPDERWKYVIVEYLVVYSA